MELEELDPWHAQSRVFVFVCIYGHLLKER